jgi:putative transposase
VEVSEAGIRYAGATYSNKFIRNQRKARVVDRIAQPGKKLEIKVDPMDLGAISVLTGDDVITVPCLESGMRGKSLRVWQQERASKRAESAADAASRADARREAYDARINETAAIKRSSDIEVLGYTDAEVQRIWEGAA